MRMYFSHLYLSSNGFSVSSPPDSACGLVCRVGDRKAVLASANVRESYILFLFLPALSACNVLATREAKLGSNVAYAYVRSAASLS